MIERVISGGQTGADQAGWRAAKAGGIPTGGWMPKGYRTEGRVNDAGFLTADESHPEFAELYGAKEHHSPEYPPRTRMNAAYVADEAGAVICFDAGERMSPGTKLLNGIVVDLLRRGLQVHHFVIRLKPNGSDPSGFSLANGAYSEAYAARFLANSYADRLMVAGNRESSAPGIGAFVERYLSEVFRLLRATAEPADLGRPPTPSPSASPVAPPHPEDDEARRIEP
jgi:hypothetical protein